MNDEIGAIKSAAFAAKVRCQKALQDLEGVFTALSFEPTDKREPLRYLTNAGDELRFALDDLQSVAPHKKEDWK